MKLIVKHGTIYVKGKFLIYKEHLFVKSTSFINALYTKSVLLFFFFFFEASSTFEYGQIFENTTPKEKRKNNINNII